MDQLFGAMPPFAGAGGDDSTGSSSSEEKEDDASTFKWRIAVTNSETSEEEEAQELEWVVGAAVERELDGVRFSAVVEHVRPDGTCDIRYTDDGNREVAVGLGRIVALYTTARPLYTIFTNIFTIRCGTKSASSTLYHIH